MRYFIKKLSKNTFFSISYADTVKCMSFFEKFLFNKSIFCVCNNSSFSSFYKYFYDNFERLHLKELCFKKDSSYYRYTAAGVEKILLEDCFLCDMFIGIPNFRLFSEYLLKFKNKDFIFLGMFQYVFTKDIFSLCVENRLFVSDRFFKRNILVYDYINNNTVRVSNLVCYFSIMDKTLFDPFKFNKYFDKSLYPVYKNYNALDVKRVRDIPDGCFSVMGVPYTYLFSHNPYLFSICGSTILCDDSLRKGVSGRAYVVNGEFYDRVFIKRI